ncbi:MAG: hypothetical protein RMI79_01580 [Nitrososphaerota archaeon]|nr:hypothetical protein [Nitrososphaerota archaeon]
MTDLREAILKAIEEYNKYRSPEAKASLVSINGVDFTIDFEGTFCQTCGVYDYLEDLIYELQSFIDVDIEISSFKEYESGKIRAIYKLKRTN